VIGPHETLYGCPACQRKSMRISRDVDGVLRLYCTQCGHWQNRGANTELSMNGGVKVMSNDI